MRCVHSQVSRQLWAPLHLQVTSSFMKFARTRGATRGRRRNSAISGARRCKRRSRGSHPRDTTQLQCQFNAGLARSRSIARSRNARAFGDACRPSRCNTCTGNATGSNSVSTVLSFPIAQLIRHLVRQQSGEAEATHRGCHCRVVGGRDHPGLHLHRHAAHRFPTSAIPAWGSPPRRRRWCALRDHRGIAGCRVASDSRGQRRSPDARCPRGWPALTSPAGRQCARPRRRLRPSC